MLLFATLGNDTGNVTTIFTVLSISISVFSRFKTPVYTEGGKKVSHG